MQQSLMRSFARNFDQTDLKRISSTVTGASGREYVKKDVLRSRHNNPGFNIYRAECVERLLLFLVARAVLRPNEHDTVAKGNHLSQGAGRLPSSNSLRN